MAGAGAASGQDAYGTVYNPALLAALRRREAAFSHAAWIEGVEYQDFLYSHPGRTAHAAFRLQRLGYGEIPAYDAAGARMGDYTASDLLVAANMARAFPRSGLSLGLGVKLARETIAGVSAQTVLADAGAAYTPRRDDRFGDLSVGLALRNAGPPVTFDRDSEPVPTEVVLGAALSLREETVVLEADGRFPLHDGPRGALGAEAWVTPALAFRAGFVLFQDEGPGVRAGFGLRVGPTQVDYAFAPMGELGQTHHIGMRLLFGGPAEEAYREGLRLLRLEKPAEAILKFNEALQLDSRHPRAARRLRQAYGLMREAEKASGP